MSNAIMSKSYTVVCIRETGPQMEMTPVADYQTAIASAKEALAKKGNTEVRVVEHKYDKASRKNRKKVVKILLPEKAGAGKRPTGKRSKGKSPGLSHEVATLFSNSIVNIVLAVTILVILAGILIPFAMR